MISLKSPRDIEGMRRAGQITAAARALAGKMVRPGVTTLEIDTAVRKFIESQGATPSFLGYGGFPASACISVNDEVIHGIPSNQVLKEGDIVSVDVGAYIGGFHGGLRGHLSLRKDQRRGGKAHCRDGAVFLGGDEVRPFWLPVSPTSPMRCRSTWKKTASLWYGTMLAMA